MYRRYNSSVERALSFFDNTLQEWADYISFLGRLLKVTSNPHGLVIRSSGNISLGITIASCRCHDDPSEKIGFQAASPVFKPITSLWCASESTRDIRLHFRINRGKRSSNRRGAALTLSRKKNCRKIFRHLYRASARC